MDSKFSKKYINLKNEIKNNINIKTDNNKNNNKINNNERNNNQSNEDLKIKQRNSCSDNNSINYYYAYKSMIFMNKITIDKITFKAFLVKIQTISNFIKLIEKLDNIYENSKEIINDSFKNFQLEKKIKLYYSFDECEYIIKNNLISVNVFIIVDKFFFKYLNIKINDINKKYVTINKNKSIYSIEFPNSNKNLNFIEIKPRIYIFNKNNIFENNKTIRLFDKIKSKYVILNITSYIKDENYLLKLIKYSKYIQKN